MAANMRQLVQQGKPEAVDTIITQCQTNSGSAVCKLESGAVEMSLGQVREDHQRDAVFMEMSFSSFRTITGPAQASHLSKKLEVYGAWFICRDLLFRGECHDLPAPCLQRVRICLCVCTKMIVFSIQRLMSVST